VAHAFAPDAEGEIGKPKKLPGEVHISRVWSGHQEEPFSSGIAYLHFFKSGSAEPALIELEDDEGDTVTLELSPLTGRVETIQGRFETPDETHVDGEEEGDE
jgi:hypothetical protein